MDVEKRRQRVDTNDFSLHLQQNTLLTKLVGGGVHGGVMDVCIQASFDQYKRFLVYVRFPKIDTYFNSSI